MLLVRPTTKVGFANLRNPNRLEDVCKSYCSRKRPSLFYYLEKTLMFVRKVAIALMAALAFASTANAGLFKKKCCEPAAPACCEPAPAPACCAAPAPAPCCAPAPAPVCCKPAPPAKVNATLCLKDPCTCCTKSVNVCIPACCAGEAPCITSRKGFLGRRVYTATWKCCGHSVTVVVTKHGKVRVR